MSRSASLRALVTDGGWVVAATVFCFFGSRGADESFDDVRHLDATGWALVFTAPLALLAARSRPRATVLATGVLVAGYLTRDYTPGPVYLTVIAAAVVAGYVLPFGRSWPPVAAVAVLLVAASALHLDGDSAATSTLSIFLWLTMSFTPWAVAAMVRMSRVSTRQAAAERERHERDTERVRIAREVHDVVGHSLAVISMQAGVALHVHERRPEQARVALDAIARSSHVALDELRRTLAVLRGDADAAATGPAGAADIAALATDFAAGGLRVTLDVTGDPPGRADVEAAAYRIVQESLTNVVRHAAAAPARVTLDNRAGRLVIDICDDGARTTPGRGTGSGLAGMRERCRALGGSFEAGPDPAGGWRVHAILPCGASEVGR